MKNKVTRFLRLSAMKEVEEYKNICQLLRMEIEEYKGALNQLSDSVGLDLVEDESPDEQQRRIWCHVINMLHSAREDTQDAELDNLNRDLKNIS